MNKEALLEEMLNELGNAQLAAYRESNETKLEESNVIWSSEYDYSEEYMDEKYQEYLDEFEPTPVEPMTYEEYLEDTADSWYEMVDEYETYEDAVEAVHAQEDDLKEQYNEYVEEFKKEGRMTTPLERERWEFSFMEQDSADQWEVKSENFAEQIFPMIEKQCHHGKLILLGTTGRWTGIAAGGDIIDADEDAIRKVMGDYDEVTVEEQDDKQLSMDFIHHDGTDTMYLYTYPEVLTELSKIMGYEDETEFESDVESGDIDAQDLEEHKGLLIRIVNTVE